MSAYHIISITTPHKSTERRWDYETKITGIVPGAVPLRTLGPHSCSHSRINKNIDNMLASDFSLSTHSFYEKECIYTSKWIPFVYDDHVDITWCSIKSAKHFVWKAQVVNLDLRASLDNCKLKIVAWPYRFCFQKGYAYIKLHCTNVHWYGKYGTIHLAEAAPHEDGHSIIDLPKESVKCCPSLDVNILFCVALCTWLPDQKR